MPLPVIIVEHKFEEDGVSGKLILGIEDAFLGERSGLKVNYKYELASGENLTSLKLKCYAHKDAKLLKKRLKTFGKRVADELSIFYFKTDDGGMLDAQEVFATPEIIFYDDDAKGANTFEYVIELGTPTVPNPYVKTEALE